VTDAGADVAPLPESVIVVGELDALLVTLTVPVKVPVVLGAKTTLKAVDWPAARESGNPSPFTEKDPPATLTLDRDTGALPVLVRVTDCVAEEPSVTVLKLREAGEADSLRTELTPVPPSEIATEELGALLVNVIPPEKLLADVGSKLTVNGADPPGATVTGSVRPEYAKPVPASDACETTRFAVPGLEIVTVCELVTPTVTLPKDTLEGTTEIAG
jgi:hypothetical protein